MSDANGYTVSGTWKGLPLFQCCYCRFNSLEEPRIRHHVVDRHIAPALRAAEPKVITKELTVPLYGPDNKIITSMEISGNGTD